jgi:hypothetical protein
MARPLEALNWLSRHADAVKLVITDQTLHPPGHDEKKPGESVWSILQIIAGLSFPISLNHRHLDSSLSPSSTSHPTFCDQYVLDIQKRLSYSRSPKKQVIIQYVLVFTF